MESIYDVIPLIGMFLAVGYIVKIALDYTTRKKLIDKGLVSEDIKYLYGNKLESPASSSLKWGIVLVLVGLVMLILKLLPYYVAGEVVVGAMLIAAGAGLLIYYAIATTRAKGRQTGNSTP
jgi:hypothetical protein